MNPATTEAIQQAPSSSSSSPSPPGITSPPAKKRAFEKKSDDKIDQLAMANDIANKEAEGGREGGGDEIKQKRARTGGSGGVWVEAWQGWRGVLASCDTQKERRAVGELLDLLEDEADRLEEGGRTTVGAGRDLLEALEAELEAARGGRGRRFQVLESGVRGLVFVRFLPGTPALERVTAAEFVRGLLNHLLGSRAALRHVVRLLPLEVTCRAQHDEILRAARSLLLPRFHPPHVQPVTVRLSPPPPPFPLSSLFLFTVASCFLASASHSSTRSTRWRCGSGTTIR
jgi:hypothetical protein